MTKKLRVIQWGTGHVGKHTVESMHNHAELELVGLDLPTIVGRGVLAKGLGS